MTETDRLPDAEDRRKVDRGGGVHVTQGGFRIRNLSLSIDATTGELGASSIIPELRAETFHQWLGISAEAAGSAERARSEALDAGLDENEKWNGALEREYRASMIAVAGAAFAVDAFYASVVMHVPETKVRSGFSRSFDLRDHEAGIYPASRAAECSPRAAEGALPTQGHGRPSAIRVGRAGPESGLQT